MSLDVTTLMFINAFVAGVGGVLLLLAWSAYRDMRPVLIWAAASFLHGAGLSLLPLSGVLALDPLRQVGLVCVVGSAALLWHAARLIEGHRPRPIFGMVGPLMTSIVVLAAPLDQVVGAQVALLSIAAYLLSTGWTVGRTEQRLASRWPLTLLIVLHALCLTLGALAAGQVGGFRMAREVIILMLAENLLFLVGTTIFVVAGLRERGEIEQRRLAMLDTLTGLHNRGSFFALAEAAAARCLAHAKPLSVAILDLDNFKRINDSYGHALGDHVLVAFGEHARQAAPPGAILGRIGGEEFALLLPEVDTKAALAIVEQIRCGFEAGAMVVGARPVNATLSAGIACSPTGSIPIAELLRHADGALYRAKEDGRNRVVLADPTPPQEQAQVVRVA